MKLNRKLSTTLTVIHFSQERPIMILTKYTVVVAVAFTLGILSIRCLAQSVPTSSCAPATQRLPNGQIEFLQSCSLTSPEQLTYAQAAGFAQIAGFSCQTIPTVIAIGAAESGLFRGCSCINVKSGLGTDWGVMQHNDLYGLNFPPYDKLPNGLTCNTITSFPGCNKPNPDVQALSQDPQQAFSYAFKRSLNGTKFSGQWITFDNNKYLNFLDAAIFGSAGVMETAGCFVQVNVQPANASLNVGGQSLQFTATAQDAQGNPVPAQFRWFPQNPSIADVDSKGIVTAKGPGTAFIYAAIDGEGVTPSPATIGTATVTVTCSTNCAGGNNGGGSNGGSGSGGTGGSTRGSGGAGSQSTFLGTVIGPLDPNDKAGSQGVGTGQYISGETPLRYAVFFTNEATASAPAQKVVVTDQLNLTTDDLNSFSLGPIALPDQLVIPPPGAADFSTTADLRPANNILVALNAHLDKLTGLLTWTFQSLDPATNLPPADPLAGFLPPGIGGSTFFTVMLKLEVPTDARVQNEAAIVFDENPSISTPAWFNTIDKDKPSSHVLALPAQSPANIPLQWAGSDVGAGVQDFTIYVSDNGSPFAPFVTQSTATSAAFAGQPGHTYAFFSTARDLVGNTEDIKTIAEATTTILADVIPPTTIAVIVPPANGNGWNNTNVTATISATDNPSGSGVQQITFSATGAQLIPSTDVPGNSASAMIGGEGVTNLNFFAKDFAQNVESAHTVPIKIDKTPPSINGSRTPSANANGWNNTNVAVSFACSDALSGLASDSPPVPTVLTSEGANQQVTGTCQDLAGNVASATVSGINIDKTPPVISGLPTAGCTLTETSKLVQVSTISSSDALSGLVSLAVIVTSSQTSEDLDEPDIVITGSGLQPRTVQLRPKVRDGAASRTFTLTSTATDAAGNVVNATSTCTVRHD